MNHNKLYIRVNNGITVLNFDFIDGYSIRLCNDQLILYVKLKDQEVEMHSIDDIISSIQGTSTGSGIYYELKQICKELVKSINIDLPRWMTDTYNSYM